MAMTINSRSKGKNGELELFKLLADELGFVVKRNLMQSREGGGDTISIPGWSLEVKRKEKLDLDAWWKQTVSQSTGVDKPILFYRQSRRKWKAMIYLAVIVNVLSNANIGIDDTATIDFNTACMIIRESLN